MFVEVDSLGELQENDGSLRSLVVMISTMLRCLVTAMVMTLPFMLLGRMLQLQHPGWRKPISDKFAGSLMLVRQMVLIL